MISKKDTTQILFCFVKIDIVANTFFQFLNFNKKVEKKLRDIVKIGKILLKPTICS